MLARESRRRGLRLCGSAGTLLWVVSFVSSVRAQDEFFFDVIQPGDDFSFLRGTAEPPPDWTTPEFDDSDWEFGPSGFGYGDGDDMTVLDDMQGSYVSVYIRRFFDITDLSEVKLMRIGMQYDDGYVAYLNGVEIARSPNFGVPGTPVPFDALAPSHDVNATPEWVTLSAEAIETLTPDDNVLAVQGHNTALTSSDLSLIPTLRIYTDVCPQALRCEERTTGGVRLRWTNVIQPAPFQNVEVFRNGKFIGNPSRVTSTIYTDATPPPGEHLYELVATLEDGEACTAISCSIAVAGTLPPFRRGDADNSGKVNLTDAVFTIIWLFQAGPAASCPDAADTDDDGQTVLTDAIFLLVHLFQMGPAPPAPGITACGVDGTDTDALGDCTYTSC